MKCERTGRWTIHTLREDGVTYGQWCTGCQDWHDVGDDSIRVDEVDLCPMCRQQLQKARREHGR